MLYSPLSAHQIVLRAILDLNGLELLGFIRVWGQASFKPATLKSDGS